MVGNVWESRSVLLNKTLSPTLAVESAHPRRAAAAAAVLCVESVAIVAEGVPWRLNARPVPWLWRGWLEH